VGKGKAFYGFLGGATIDRSEAPLFNHTHVVLQPVHMAGQHGERHQLWRQHWREHQLRPPTDSGPNADVQVMHAMARLMVMVNIMVDVLVVAFS